MVDTTDKLGFLLPEVGADRATWGGYLNTNWTQANDELSERLRLDGKAWDGSIAAVTNPLHFVVDPLSDTTQIIFTDNIATPDLSLTASISKAAGELQFQSGGDNSAPSAAVPTSQVGPVESYHLMTLESTTDKFFIKTGDNSVDGQTTFVGGAGNAFSVNSNMDQVTFNNNRPDAYQWRGSGNNTNPCFGFLADPSTGFGRNDGFGFPQVVVGGQSLFKFDAVDDAIPNTTSVVTREGGDGRYARLTQMAAVEARLDAAGL